MSPETETDTLRVMLVDDEPRIRDMVQEILTSEGVAESIESYEEPLEFLTALKQADDPPDLVLLDVHFENSGLSGVDTLPFIREEHPYLPVLLLTGMEGEAIADAQEFECTYYIPKPVSPEHLVRMVKFYTGMGRKSGKRMEELSRDVEEYKELAEMLEQELAGAAAERMETPEPEKTSPKEDKAFDRMIETLKGLLKRTELMDSFVADLKRTFTSDFKLFKKAVETMVHFDLSELSAPGLNVHKVKGAESYTLRLSRKARIFFYLSKSGKRRLLRLDAEHATKDMDKWLKSNYESYADR
jgi:CheY-like chemotaxis protein